MSETAALLEIFGIRLRYLPTWRIVPDQTYTLTYDSGLFRFEENVMEKRSRVSLGLRWESSQSDNETFLREFGENMEREYQKSLKGKSHQLEMLRNEILETDRGVRLRFIETQYKATQSLVNNPRKMQRLRVCNAAFYCETTHRMVIASLVTTPQYMEENRERLERCLLSLETRKVYSPEEETQRMEERARRREAARQKAQRPLAGLAGRFRKKEKPNMEAPEAETQSVGREDTAR